MNIIREYEALVEAKEWEKAVALADAILERNPSVPTSWFNKGVCLDELKRHGEAAEAFIKAQEVSLYDVGIHYRIYRSLMLAESDSTFCEFADYSIGLIPDLANSLRSDPEFGHYLSRQEMVDILEKHGV